MLTSQKIHLDLIIFKETHVNDKSRLRMIYVWRFTHNIRLIRIEHTMYYRFSFGN